jgi:regulatory protein
VFFPWIVESASKRHCEIATSRDPGSTVTACVILRQENVVGRTVTAIKGQVKARKRVSVFLDGEYAFSVRAALASGLQVGQDLTEAQIADLVDQDNEERAYQRALRLLSSRPRSEQEIRARLTKIEIPVPIQDRALARLRTMDLVNDQAFVQSWIENRMEFRPRSARHLRHELRQKGIKKAHIDSALADYDDGIAAYRAAQKIARRERTLDKGHFKKRIYSYLSRRGFDYETISSVTTRLWHEVTGAEEESEGST